LHISDSLSTPTATPESNGQFRGGTEQVVLAAWGNSRLDAEARSMVLVDANTDVETEPVVVDRATAVRSTDPTSFQREADRQRAFVDR